MRFWKYQGIGNDFIVIEDADLSAPTSPDIVRRMCDRRFGIGADGVLYIRPGMDSDITMKIMNSDGSEPEMCGNGIRCVAKHVRDRGIVRKDEFTVRTLAGNRTVRVADGTVEVDMGTAMLDCADVPMECEGRFVNGTVDVNGRSVTGTAVSMGNPHFVTFDDLTDTEMEELGPAIGSLPVFPDRANVEFAKVTDGRIDVKVYERGAGWTLACGTGACAAAVAAALNGSIPYGKAADVRLPGGTLRITVRKDLGHVTMAGPAELVYEGMLVI